jgi:tight adherence protein B
VSVLILLLGACAGAGVLVLVGGLRPPSIGLPGAWRVVSRWRPGVIGLAGSVAVFALTGWPVLGLLTMIGSVVLPRVLSGAQRRAATERSEAVARWIEMLRDTMAGAAGLEEAVAVTARRPPPAIRDAVRQFATRLHHQPLPVALQGFARQVDDPGAELLTAALITAATNETRDLGQLLSALADATHAQARMRHSIDTGRAQVRSATRLVLAVTLAFSVALLVFSREYLAPYATAEGQLWLALVGVVFFAALVLLVRLDRIDLPEHHLMSGTATDRTEVQP